MKDVKIVAGANGLGTATDLTIAVNGGPGDSSLLNNMDSIEDLIDTKATALPGMGLNDKNQSTKLQTKGVTPNG